MEIFTPEFINSIKKPGQPFERRYINYLSTYKRIEWVRDKIEHIIVKYLAEKKPSLIDRIRSEDDTICLSAISELYVFDLLISNFKKVEVEPELKFLNGKMPDFFVDDKYIFEVATLFTKINPFEFEIYEALNEIEGNTKVMLGSIYNLPKTSPKLSEIKKEFEDLFEKHKSTEMPVDFEIKTKQGIVIGGRLHSGKPEHSTVGAIVSGLNDDEDSKKRTRNVIRAKLRKYNQAKLEKVPFFIVLYNLDDNLIFDEDWDEIIFGAKKFIFDEKGVALQNIIRENSVIQKGQNRSLSGLLIRDYDSYNSGHNYIMVKNKFAFNPIDEIEGQIKVAFKARPLIK